MGCITNFSFLYMLFCIVQNNSFADVHNFAAIFSSNNESISGYYSLDLGAGVISKISSSDKWKSGEGNVEVSALGIGLSKILIQYDLQKDSVLENEIQIGSAGNEISSSRIRRNTIQKIDAFVASQLTTKIDDEWLLMNTSRTVVKELKFDKVVIQCSGFSAWTNGSGNTVFTGGIRQYHVNLFSTVPVGESGMSTYNCEFSSFSAGKTHRRSRQLQTDSSPKRSYSVQQIYGSIYENGFISWQFNQEIISYGGGAEWINGTGTFAVVAGGTGHDILEFKASGIQENVYGIYSYNVTLRI